MLCQAYFALPNSVWRRLLSVLDGAYFIINTNGIKVSIALSWALGCQSWCPLYSHCFHIYWTHWVRSLPLLSSLSSKELCECIRTASRRFNLSLSPFSFSIYLIAMPETQIHLRISHHQLVLSIIYRYARIE